MENVNNGDTKRDLTEIIKTAKIVKIENVDVFYNAPPLQNESKPSSKQGGNVYYHQDLQEHQINREWRHPIMSKCSRYGAFIFGLLLLGSPFAIEKFAKLVL